MRRRVTVKNGALSDHHVPRAEIRVYGSRQRNADTAIGRRQDRPIERSKTVQCGGTDEKDIKIQIQN